MSLLPGMAPGARFGGTTRVSRQDRGRDSGCTPGDRHGAMRRRWCEWEQPHTLSWRAAWAADAEWMSGKSRNRLAPDFTEASSWMSVRRAPDTSACARMSIRPTCEKLRTSEHVLGRFLRAAKCGYAGEEDQGPEKIRVAVFPEWQLLLFQP